MAMEIDPMSVDDEDLAPGGKNLAEFATFEEFLDSSIIDRDMHYIGDIHVVRRLIELGYRSNKDGFSEEQFKTAKAVMELRKLLFNVRGLVSDGMTITDPFLRALQAREEGNRTGKNCSIIYIRDVNKLGQEVSGYVDYGHRLTQEDFRPIFRGEKKLVPKKTDLSYFNWQTLNVGSRSTNNYQVIAKDISGMVFRNMRDGKIVNPDPRAKLSGGTSRTVIQTSTYLSVVIYDHYNRRRV